LDVVSDAEEEWIPAVFYSAGDSQTAVRVLRGKKMRTTPRLMDELGAALQFFYGFGENWHALKEGAPVQNGGHSSDRIHASAS